MLFEKNLHEWKIISLFLTENYFGKNFMDLLIFPDTLLKKCQNSTEKF